METLHKNPSRALKTNPPKINTLMIASGRGGPGGKRVSCSRDKRESRGEQGCSWRNAGTPPSDVRNVPRFFPFNESAGARGNPAGKGRETPAQAKP